MNNFDQLCDHSHLTRRYFLQLGSLAAAAWHASPLAAADSAPDHPLLKDAIAKLEYLHPLDGIKIADKARAGVLKFPPEKLREVGLVPETWSLEIVADTESTSAIEQPFTRAQGNALDWKCLMKLAERHAVRFLHPCICAFGDDPFHNSLWEGIPLREIIWMAKPKANIRRVIYQSYHPEDRPPFQASLPLAQVLETPPGQVPPVLAYKMNGELIPAAHGGPARVVVPGMYGDKAIKWIQRIVLTNDFKASDSDAAVHNADTESPMKTKARFVNAPTELKSGSPAALTGYALVGISGLAKVQYCVHSHNDPRPSDDPYWTKADWRDAAILPAPTNWGRGIAGGKLPPNTSHMDPAKGTPLEWPIRFTLTHWAALLPGLPAGKYDLCCRTIDHNGIAQPMPRPFPRSGNNGIHRVTLTVKA